MRKEIIMLFTLLQIFSCACNHSNSSANTVTQDATAADTQLKTGGIYLIKNKAGKYTVSKILAMDNFAIHVRMYADEFETRPTQISTANLKVMIGHAPMDAKGFLAEYPELLNMEDVKETELEGYRIYLEEMQK